MMSIVQDYVTAVIQGDSYESPSPSGLVAMSQLIDASGQRAFQEAEAIMDHSRSIRRDVRTMRRADRLCGEFSPATAVLSERTSYEQMKVAKEWMEQDNPRQIHTIALSAPEDSVVPVYVRSPPKSRTTLMHIALGNGRGALKAPKYSQWAEEDPRSTPQEVFVNPLNSLEIHRQPHCIGALLLKSGAYHNEDLDASWRYQVEENGSLAKTASVEIPKQSSRPAKQIKAQSAGYNLAKMIETDSLRETNLLPELHYVDFHDDYNEDAIAEVTPEAIVRAFPDAIRGSTEELDALVKKLFAVHLQGSAITAVKTFTARALFPE